MLSRPKLSLVGGFFLDDGFHLGPVLLHFFDELELGATAVEVVFVTMDGEVVVPVEVVCEEAEAAFEGHGFGPQRHSGELGIGEVGAGFVETADVHPETIEIDGHEAEVFLILKRSCGSKANGIAEVIEGEARHDRIKVDDAEGFSALVIQEDVVEFGVIVGDTEREFACLQKVLELAHFFFARENEGDLFLDLAGAAVGVFGQNFLEDPVTVGGVVEVRDGLVEGFGGEVCEVLHEAAKGERTLIEVLIRLGELKAQGLRDKDVDAPVAIGVLEVVVAVLGLDEGEDAAGIVLLGPLMSGDAADVFHEFGHVLEHGVVDFLKDVPGAFFGDGQVRDIDMPGTVGFAGNGFGVEPKVPERFH